MFINLFRALRRRGVPVTFNEWLLLQRGLSENLADSSLVRFYYLARSILVKSEAHFDKYDQAFLECFRQIESTEELVRLVEAEMLRLPPLALTEEEKALIEKLELAEVEANFLEQLRARNLGPHEGGNRAIGVRGRSTQGAGGFNPAGVRLGQGSGRMGSAVKARLPELSRRRGARYPLIEDGLELSASDSPRGAPGSSESRPHD
jgi:uncharacterized protein